MVSRSSLLRHNDFCRSDSPDSLSTLRSSWFRVVLKGSLTVRLRYLHISLRLLNLSVLSDPVLPRELGGCKVLKGTSLSLVLQHGSLVSVRTDFRDHVKTRDTPFALEPQVEV